jgi:hypothetical protein
MAFHGFRSRLPRHPAKAGKSRDNGNSACSSLNPILRSTILSLQPERLPL